MGMATVHGYMQGVLGGCASVSQGMQATFVQQTNNASAWITPQGYPIVGTINPYVSYEGRLISEIPTKIQHEIKGDRLCLCSRHLW